MKKLASQLFLALILTLPAFAGTTTLTTYYPAPRAAYKQIQLSTNSYASITSGSQCAGSGLVFLNTTSGHMEICTSPGNSTAYCSSTYSNAAVNNGFVGGTLYADKYGDLHVCACQNGTPPQCTERTYPQQCFNRFCTFDSTQDPSGINTCGSGAPSGMDFLDSLVGTAGGAPGALCPNGFSQAAIDPNADPYDQFDVSPDTHIIYVVCCSS